jgi:tetratricopeptide (TPR) repeat protein
VALPILITVVLCETARAQQWEWPERSQNLKVLPADLPGEKLAGVMRSFSRSLGVRCSHCHVGEAGQPLETYDFASDEVAAKEVARVMMRMVGDIRSSLETVESSGPERVNVSCFTCHRGVPRPMKLEDALHETYVTFGDEAMLEQYESLRQRFYGRSAYDFGEGSLDELGSMLLEDGQTETAITVFRLNTEQFPESADAYDSLAEAYLAAGQTDLAISSYEKSLEIDPGNRNATRRLRELRSSDQ